MRIKTFVREGSKRKNAALRRNTRRRIKWSSRWTFSLFTRRKASSARSRGRSFLPSARENSAAHSASSEGSKKSFQPFYSRAESAANGRGAKGPPPSVRVSAIVAQREAVRDDDGTINRSYCLPRALIAVVRWRREDKELGGSLKN